MILITSDENGKPSNEWLISNSMLKNIKILNLMLSVKESLYESNNIQNIICNETHLAPALSQNIQFNKIYLSQVSDIIFLEIYYLLHLSILGKDIVNNLNQYELNKFIKIAETADYLNIEIILIAASKSLNLRINNDKELKNIINLLN